VEPTQTDIEKVLEEAQAHGWRRRATLAVFVAFAVALAGWFWVVRVSQSDKFAYVTEQVARGDLVVTVTATGTVEPTDLVEISSELSGTVRRVYVDANDRVTAGQVLAKLDTEKLEAALAHSKAALEARYARVAEAEATVAETHAQYERIKELAERNAASIQSLQAAEAAHARADAAAEVARADAKVAEADLAIDETNLAKACICAPIGGVILLRNVDVGQIVASSLQAPVLFTIAADLSEMELRVDIDEADVGAVQVGQKARFTVEAHQGRSFPAEIAEVSFAPQTIEGVVTYEAILSIDNSDRQLRPGMTATAEITVNEINAALLVPNSALRFAPPAEPTDTGSGGGGLLGLLIRNPHNENRSVPAAPEADGTRTIWTLRDDVATPAKVRTGPTDGQSTVILDGDLTEGDPVITDLVED
jgi:HlyD family secretion protein